MSDMKGKTLVITGATKGIGKAVAEKFAQNGVNIAFTYNSNKEAAIEIAADLESKYGVKAKAYPLNILELDEFTYKDRDDIINTSAIGVMKKALKDRE